MSDTISQHLKSISRRQRDWLGLRNPADLERWCGYSLWSLQEALILLLGFEPIDEFTGSDYTTIEFDEIYKCLNNDVSAGHVEYVVDWPNLKVKPAHFVKWADAYFEKSIYYLPVLKNWKDIYIEKCTAEDQRIVEYTMNLAKIKACLGVCSSKEQNGFKWISKKTDLNELREELIRYKFIEDITSVEFDEAFCYGPSNTTIVWLSTLVALRYLLDELKRRDFIETEDFCAQAEEVFKRRTKKELAKIGRETLHVSKKWSFTDIDKNNKQKLIDTIINDLLNGVAT